MVSARPFGSGHINDTFKVTTTTGNNYLLQKINNFVFKDVPALMNNVVNITHHLSKKLNGIKGAVPEKQVLTLIGNQQTTAILLQDVSGSPLLADVCFFG